MHAEVTYLQRTILILFFFIIFKY